MNSYISHTVACSIRDDLTFYTCTIFSFFPCFYYFFFLLEGLLWIFFLSSSHFWCQVSHHPMIVACHCEGTGWKFWGDSNLKSKFWGRSIQVDPVGILTLEFDDGEVFQWSKVFLQWLKWYSFFSWFQFEMGFLLSGHNINIQSHIGKAVLRSLWYNAYTGKSRVFM